MSALALEARQQVTHRVFQSSSALRLKWRPHSVQVARVMRGYRCCELGCATQKSSYIWLLYIGDPWRDGEHPINRGFCPVAGQSAVIAPSLMAGFVPWRDVLSDFVPWRGHRSRFCERVSISPGWLPWVDSPDVLRRPYSLLSGNFPALHRAFSSHSRAETACRHTSCNPIVSLVESVPVVRDPPILEQRS